jgi:Xaa-Pro dipeptidase
LQIYFNKFLLAPVLEDPELSKYVDQKMLDKYWSVGGVRIEDDVHILENGYENLTTTPKSGLELTTGGTYRGSQ